MAASVAAVAGLSSACEVDPIADVDLEDVGGATAASECVEVVVDEVLPEYYEVLQVAADGPAYEGYWALVVGDDPIDEGAYMLFLVRVPSGPEQPIDPIAFGLDPSYADLLELVPGAVPGEAYLWYDVPELNQTVLQRFDAGIGGGASNSSLNQLPSTDFATNPEQWHRRFLLIDGAPHMLAMPPDSQSIDPEGKSLDMIFYLAELDEYLHNKAEWAPLFGSTCNPEEAADQCDRSVIDVRVGRGSGLTSVQTASIAFQRIIRYHDTSIFGTGNGTDPYEAGDLSMLRIRKTALGHEGFVITVPAQNLPEAVSEQPVLLDPFEMAQDPYAVILNVQNSATDLNNRALLRLDTTNDDFSITQSVPLSPAARLVQLDHEAVLAEVDEDGLSVVPLQDPSGWGFWAPRTVHRLPGLESLDAAGPGMLVLHREDGEPPQLVHIACTKAAD